MTTGVRSSDYVPPKVFISYSWTPDEYADWIKNLAKKLLDNGVDVIFDRWDLKPGQDKYVFMEQMVTNPEIKKVLNCSESLEALCGAHLLLNKSMVLLDYIVKIFDAP